MAWRDAAGNIIQTPGEKQSTSGNKKPTPKGFTISPAGMSITGGFQDSLQDKIKEKTAEQVATFNTKKALEKRYGRTLSPSTVKALEEKASLIASAQALKDEMEIKKYQTGPMMTLIPTIALQLKDPDFANFSTNLETIFQKEIRKPITGAAAATSELNQLRPIAPQKWQTPELLNKRLNESIYGTKRAYNIALEELKKAGYDVSGYTPFKKEETEIELDVISPDGKQEGTIPLSQLKDALKEGYKLKER